MVPRVSDAELEVLKVLWDAGPATVRDLDLALRRQKRRWAYNTILTLLSRLREKGLVSSKKAGTAHTFTAIVTREQLLRAGLTQLSERVADGTASPLVHALVKGRKFSAEDIASLRKLLDELEGGR